MSFIRKMHELLKDQFLVITWQLRHVFEENGDPWKAELLKVILATT